jgi:hypothetical protein
VEVQEPIQSGSQSVSSQVFSIINGQKISNYDDDDVLLSSAVACHLHLTLFRTSKTIIFCSV